MTAVQNRYSMMARWYESLFPVLEELGIGYVAFSPLANGFLSGRYDKTSRFDSQTDYRSVMPQFQPESIDRNQALVSLLNNLAADMGATPRPDFPGVDAVQKAVPGTHPRYAQAGAAAGERRSRGHRAVRRGGQRHRPGAGRHGHVAGFWRNTRGKSITLMKKRMNNME